jgi:hypothetical protein
VALCTVAVIPLKVMVFSAGVDEKFIPLIVTFVPTGPLSGSTELIPGALASTVKVGPVAVSWSTMTLISPLTAPCGTFVLITSAAAESTEALIPLNVTVSPDARSLKPLPSMGTTIPCGPDRGVYRIYIELWRWVGTYPTLFVTTSYDS